MKQVPHDPQWRSAYESEARSIREALGSSLVSIEHVGSTAVAGLRAKPIIDILVSVGDWENRHVHVAAFASLGYVYTPHSEADDPGRRVFRKPTDMTLERTHHAHVTQPDSAYWRRIIGFRDYLRSNRDAARRYAELKQRLATDFAGDPDSYTRGKAEFVREIEQHI